MHPERKIYNITFKLFIFSPMHASKDILVWIFFRLWWIRA